MADIDFTDKSKFPFGRFGIRNPVEELPGGTFRPLTSVDIQPSSQNLVAGVATPTIPTPSTVSIPQLQLTPQESQQSALIQRLISEGPTQARQEAEFRTQEEAAQDVTGKTQAIEDIYTQLQQIQAEQAALQSERAAVLPSLEQQAGRGTSAFITSFALGRQVEKAERDIALRGLALSARAATTSALFNAAQGRLASAERDVEKAVRDKFAGQKAEREALLQNLDLLSRDPALTVEQKNRALAVEKQAKIQEQLEEQNQKNYEENLRLANSLVSQGFQDTVTLQRIQEAKDERGNYSIAEAQRIVAETGFLKQEKDELLSVAESEKLGVPFGTTRTQATKMGIVPGQVAGTTLGGGTVSSQTQAIINNPSLFDDLTPTVRGKVISELQRAGYDTSNLGTKALSDTAIKEISQTQKALSDLGNLRTIILGNQQYLGPIRGWAVLNPWSKARRVQADIDRVKQTVGKALEGGVLRKEDEEKYKKILATLLDTPETAIYKVDALLSSIQRDIENYKSLQQLGGRSLNVNAPLQKTGEVIPVEQLRNRYNY